MFGGKLVEMPVRALAKFHGIRTAAKNGATAEKNSLEITVMCQLR
jgi:hypothetical protein